ncbi:telomere length and silencing protein 1 homolog [Contarinia nasturtii]|uniref:telomere length and silencing protein 1 homolog n=1 Tax=Contarinia nasturtii TaxID=265458 RepID=UPI0012D3CEBF|nr:telomere length and silencing protein 1 homolog [Contarinia nasturtii]
MSEEIKFKPKKVKNLRVRRNSSDEDEEHKDDEDVLAKLEETKLAQKLRIKPKGVNAVALAIGKKVTPEDLVLKNDPFKIKSGGILNMKNIKSGKMQQVDDAYDVGIGTQFSAETNKRDEDEEMMKYIEEQLNKRKNSKIPNGAGGDNDNENFDEKYLSPEEAALLSLPEHLRVSSTHRSEEMLSNQMLNGIPEVDLGIDIKIKNIEATEAAKEKLIRDQKNKKSTPSQFVPSNMAVNFVQHNRFNIDDSETKRRRQKMQEERERQGEASKKPNVKRATDDYHYDKFRKQFRRY